MTEEKQIEEMANTYYDAMLKARGTLGSMNEGAPKWYAKAFYNAGYRRQEWISVEDRLPDTDELCLLSMENRITKYRWVVIGYFHTNYDEYVTHWMPLPEAPKMKGGAE